MAKKTALSQCKSELEDLGLQLAKAEEALRALQQGGVDVQAELETRVAARTEALERANAALSKEAVRREAAEEARAAVLEEVRRQNDELERSRAAIESQARYPEENPNPVMRLDPESALVYANYASLPLLAGWEWKRGQKAPDLLRDLLAQARTNGEDQIIDVTCGGRVYELHLALVPGVDYVNVYGRDITKRRLAEQAVREARDELEATFMSMAEAVLVYDLTGKIVHANPVAVKLRGVDPLDFCLANMPRRLSTRHPDGRPLAVDEAPSARALHGDTVLGERYILTPADQEDITVMVSAAPLMAAGQVSGAVTVWQDVTEQERTNAQLEESRRLPDALMEYVPEGITIADAPDMTIRMVSRYGQELLGGPHAGRTAQQVAAQWQVFQPDGVTPWGPQ